MFVIKLISQIRTQSIGGSIISETIDQSCARIVDDQGNAPLDCDNATVLILDLEPNTEGGGVSFIFKSSGRTSGGGSVVNEQTCASDGPGDCLQGREFQVVVSVTPLVTSYSLNTMGLDNPFGYVYGNCLTPMNQGQYGPYPDEINDLCGVTTSHQRGDYISCTDPNSFPYLGSNPQPSQLPEYTECAIQCEWEKDLNGYGGANGCATLINNLQQEAIFDLPDIQRKHLACPASEYGQGINKNDDECAQPNFPQPRSLCPCSRSYTASDSDPTGAATTDYASMVVCKNGGCVGTCGTALVLSDDIKNAYPDPENCLPETVNSICVNTQQPHRCLKCQPHMENNASPKNQCYYLDIDIKLTCEAGGNGNTNIQVCGSGDDIFGGHNDPGEGDDASPKHRDARQCNCDANFVERAYWTSPVCQPFIINNPPRVEYTVVVEFWDMENNYIEGSRMIVGSGFDNITGTTILPISNATSDGFAMTRILSLDSITGSIGRELHGLIVICDDGRDNACTLSSNLNTSINLNSAALPSALLDVSSKDGRINPWGPPIYDQFEAKVPLPDMIYRYKTQNAPEEDAQNAQKNAWWYYESPANSVNYGRGCGQNGWANYGPADATSARTMCNGLQGTCVPGVDVQFKGEIIDTPCSVASEFIKFWRRNGRSNGATTTCAGYAEKNQGLQPKHVPLDWDPVFPNYWVTKGRLYNDKDPTLANIGIRLEIAIAAEFQESEITQAKGKLIPVATGGGGCQLLVVVGGGSLQVRVQDLGTTSAEYVLDANCTTGIIASEVGPFGVSVGAVPGTDPGVVQSMPLTITTSFTTADPDSSGIGCTVNLHPSLDTSVTFDSLFIQCQAEFGIPIIAPKANLNLTFGDGIGNFTPGKGNACSMFSPLCGISFNQGLHLTPVQIEMITFMVFFTIFTLAIIGMLLLIENAYGEARAEQVYTAEIQNDIAKSQQLAEMGREILKKRQGESTNIQKSTPKKKSGGKLEQKDPEDLYYKTIKKTISPERLEYLQMKFGEDWIKKRELSKKLFRRQHTLS